MKDDPIVERLRPENRALYVHLREHGDPLTGRPMSEASALAWLVGRDGRSADLYQDDFDRKVATWQDLHEAFGSSPESAHRAGVRDVLKLGGWRSEDQARVELREARRLKEAPAAPPMTPLPSIDTDTEAGMAAYAESLGLSRADALRWAADCEAKYRRQRALREAEAADWQRRLVKSRRSAGQIVPLREPGRPPGSR